MFYRLPVRIKFAAFSLVCFSTGALAAESLIDLTPRVASVAAPQPAAKSVYRHARPPANVSTKREQLEFRSAAPLTPGVAGSTSSLFGNRYPADLDYHGGHVATTMASHAILVNTLDGTAREWGDPLTFLSDLGNSDFIHIIDQFVGATASHRYTLSPHNYQIQLGSIAGPLTDADLQGIVALAVAAKGEAGYTHEYHVFLPPGVDECFDSTFTVCYSPDIPNTFYFCAYHGSFDVPGVGHVLYSVEPYQNVSGCSDTGAVPNGTLTDSTNSVLSHELFETITDPDGDAWWNSTGNGLYGEEIGDECSFINATGFDPSLYYVNGKLYAAQPEYSNVNHSCRTKPPGD